MPRGNDSRDHDNRKVSRDALWNRHIAQQEAMWKGIDAAAIASHVSELDEEAGDRITHSQDTDIAPAQGIPRPRQLGGGTPVSLYPNKNTFMPVEGSFTPHEPDPNGEGEPDTPEDAEERANLREERRKEHGW